MTVNPLVRLMFISDVERARHPSGDERAEELIQVLYFTALLRGTFISFC